MKKLEGADPCRACDMRTLLMVGEGPQMTAEDFPQKCPYYTEDPKVAEAAVKAWKDDTQDRQARLEVIKKDYV
jgi:hypothetical protein